MTGKKIRFDAILVAGEGESSYKVYHRHKAFLEINGKHIVNYVVQTLQQVEAIARIFIVGQKEPLKAVLAEGNIGLDYPKPIYVIAQRANLYENIWHTFLESLPDSVNREEVDRTEYRDKAVLIVPCDSPLITPHEVEYFIRHADLENHDHVLGLTAEESLKHFYPADGKPGIKMAYLHLKEKSYRLNNLHLVKPVRIENRHYIQKMYQYRYQRNFKNLILFGLSLFGKDKAVHYRYYIGLQMGLLFGGLGWNGPLNYFRTWTPKRKLEESISTIMKTRFVAMEVPFPGAALDIDNDRDYETMKARFDEWREYLSHPENSLLSFSN
jgi:molybdopterin-guanine dinucleotide biosynthesis protein A